MKTVLSAMLALTFALGASTSVLAADPAVEATGSTLGSITSPLTTKEWGFYLRP